MADKVGLEVSVSALRVAVVGAKLEVGCEEGAGVVTSASEKQEGFSNGPIIVLIFPWPHFLSS